jgi:hypothetical protein
MWAYLLAVVGKQLHRGVQSREAHRADKISPSLCPTFLRCPVNFGVSGKNVHQDRENRYNWRPLVTRHPRQIDQFTSRGSGHQIE